MTKIYCSDVSCKYVGDDGYCSQKKVSLAWGSVQTLHQGRLEYHKCKAYEVDPEYKRLEKLVLEAIAETE